MQTTAFASAFAGSVAAFQFATQQRQGRQQLRVSAKDSRIGKVPITVPAKVDVKVNGRNVVVKVRGASGRAMRWPGGLQLRRRLRKQRPGLVAACTPLRSQPCSLTDTLLAALQGPKGELQRTFHPLVKIEQVGRWCGNGMVRWAEVATARQLCMRAGWCFCPAWCGPLASQWRKA